MFIYLFSSYLYSDIVDFIFIGVYLECVYIVLYLYQIIVFKSIIYISIFLLYILRLDTLTSMIEHFPKVYIFIFRGSSEFFQVVCILSIMKTLTVIMFVVQISS